MDLPSLLLCVIAAAIGPLAGAIGFIFAGSGISNVIVSHAAKAMGSTSGSVCVPFLSFFAPAVCALAFGYYVLY